MAANAVHHKLEGNRLFSAKKYEEAIKQYTKAINKSGSTAVFYTNRALCNIKLKRWNEVKSDCKIAIEHDPNTVKGYFFMGQADIEVEKFEDAIVHLAKAQDLAQRQKLNYGDDIAATLREAKRKRWSKFEEKRVKQEIELQSYLNNLINQDKEKEKRKLESSGKEISDAQSQDIEEKFENRLQELNSMFSQVDERRQTREVPDYLCGKISFEIMKDPVITPSGITYDRKGIEEHLQRVGHFDPVTRCELKSNQLIPNLAMREVVSHFVEENGWVEEY